MKNLVVLVSTPEDALRCLFCTEGIGQYTNEQEKT